MLPQEEIDEQLQLLRTYRRTLATYLRQQATLGEAYSPPALLNGIADARSHIQRIKAALRAAGVEVPEDIGDAEPPPTAPGRRNRGRISLIALVIGAGVLLAIGLALGRFGAPWLSGQAPTSQVGLIATAASPAAPLDASTPEQEQPAEPASETSDATAPAAAEPTDTAAFAEYTFADGTADGWSGLPEQWQVVRGDAGYVYQAQAPASDYTAATPPDVGTLAMLRNYAVEMRVKIVQPDVPDDDLPAMWLSLRAQPAPSDTCDSYNFRFSLANSSATISLAGDTTGCDRMLAQGPLNLDTNTWHTVRAEVNDAQITLFVDGTAVVSATDTALTQGFFYITVGPGATVQFADIQLHKL